MAEYNTETVDTFNSRNIKFALRRIEHNIDLEESVRLILNFLKSNINNITKLIDIINIDIINKEEVLNKIAVACFNNSFYDLVIPLLSKSYELNSLNKDTIYNIGYVLYRYGEKKLALEYLIKIYGYDSEVKLLVDKIRGELLER